MESLCVVSMTNWIDSESYEGSGKVWTTFRGTILILADYVVGGRMDDFQIEQVFLGVQNVFVYSDGAGRRFNHLVVGPY